MQYTYDRYDHSNRYSFSHQLAFRQSEVFHNIRLSALGFCPLRQRVPIKFNSGLNSCYKKNKNKIINI